MRSWSMLMKQEQDDADQSRGQIHCFSRLMHSQLHVAAENDLETWHVMFWVSWAQVHVHVSLSTTAWPGHERGRHWQAQSRSSSTWTITVSQTLSMYWTSTLTFLTGIHFIFAIEVFFFLPKNGINRNTFRIVGSATNTRAPYENIWHHENYLNLTFKNLLICRVDGLILATLSTPTNLSPRWICLMMLCNLQESSLFDDSNLWENQF